MYKSSRSQMFFKIGVFKNFKIFTGKHLCWSLFLLKLQAFRQPAVVFCKKGVLKNFANFTGKHLCWSLFLILFQASTLQLFKKRLQHRGFPVKFAKFLEHLIWRTSANDCFSITFLQFCSECENIIFDVVCWTSGRLWKIRQQSKRISTAESGLSRVESATLLLSLSVVNSFLGVFVRV